VKSTRLVGIEDLFHDVSKEWFERSNDSYLSNRHSGIFSQALTIYLMVCQRAFGLSLQGSIIEMLSGGKSGIFAKRNSKSKKLSFGTVSKNSGGLSRAQDRIKPTEIVELASHCINKITKNTQSPGKIYLIDGTCMTTSYSKENEARYPRHSFRKDKCVHFPRLRAITAHNLANGLALEPKLGSITDSEQKLTWDFLADLPTESTVIGDRNFGVFSIAYRSHCLGHKVLFRLNEAIYKRVVGKVSAKDRDSTLTWSPSKYDLKTTADIPKESSLQGRFIQIRAHKKGHRPEVLFFFTTLDLPVAQIAELYKQRQRIETHIRQLKQFLKMEFIAAKTPERIQKEISIAFLTFNLISAIMLTAAKHNKVPFERISFTAAQRIINAYGDQLQIAETREQRDKIIKSMFAAFDQTKIPLRTKSRSYPRTLKRKPNKYPVQAQIDRPDNQILEDDGK